MHKRNGRFQGKTAFETFFRRVITLVSPLLVLFITVVFCGALRSSGISIKKHPQKFINKFVSVLPFYILVQYVSFLNLLLHIYGNTFIQFEDIYTI